MRVRSIVVVGLVLVIGAACGTNDNGGTIDAGGGTTTTGGSTGGAGQAQLTVKRLDSNEEATLTCDGATATGTGWLAEPAAASAACDLVLTSAEARQRLVDGPKKGLMCTQIYGGPEQAAVAGTLGGEKVDTTFHRTDGCGVSDWTLLQPLLGAPGQ